jgi:hypothetical protein
MARMKAERKILLKYLDALEESLIKAREWVDKKNDPILIEVPQHLQTGIDPKTTCFAPDDQAIVEVLWFILDAMESEASARRKRRRSRKPTAR